MEKFFGRLTSISIITVFLITGLNKLYVMSNYYKSYLARQDIEKFFNMPENISIASFGNSHGEYGIDWSVVEDETTFNFALSSQGITYDYMLLDYFQNNIAQEAIIVLPISYFSLHGADRMNVATDRYYSILDSSHIFNCSLKDYFVRKYCPLLLATPEELIEMIKTKEVEQFKKWDGTVALYRDGINQLITDTASTDYKNILESTGGEMNPIILEYLDDFVKICNEKSCKLYFVTTPYTSLYTESFPRDFLQKWEKDVQNLTEQYSIEWLNYSKDSRFCNDLALFRDGDHLSEEGALRFTEILYHDICVQEMK